MNAATKLSSGEWRKTAIDTEQLFRTPGVMQSLSEELRAR